MQKSSTSISVIFLTLCCDVAVFLGAAIVLWMAFEPELQELVCLSFGAGSLICQFKVAKLMSDEGVADPVTSLIFAIFLVHPGICSTKSLNLPKKKRRPRRLALPARGCGRPRPVPRKPRPHRQGQNCPWNP